MLSDASLVRFDPATPLTWRTNGSLVVGYTDSAGSKPLRIHAEARQVAVWLSLLDGSRRAEDLVTAGQAMGISESKIRALLHRLVESGHAYEVTTLRPPANRLLPTLRYAGAVTGQSTAALAQRRSQVRINVRGAGALALCIYSELRRSFPEVSWSTNSTLRIRPEDLLGTELTNNQVGLRWKTLAATDSACTFQIVVADALDPDQVVATVPTLPITAHRQRIAIGPLLNLEGGICCECLHQARSERDSDWPFTLTQLLHRNRPLPVIAPPWLGLISSQVAGLVTNLFDSGEVGELINHSQELIPPSIRWRLRKYALRCQRCKLEAA